MKFARSLLRAAIVAGTIGVSLAAAWAADRPANFPPTLRWDLVSKWIAWDATAGKATVSWPPNDGCAAAPVSETLPPGTKLDRFGSEYGNFLSPKGDSFRSRAVPYVCKAMDYRSYTVTKPLAIKTCAAAPWFGEPGGSKQVQTPKAVIDLLKDGSLQRDSEYLAANGGPTPQCGG